MQTYRITFRLVSPSLTLWQADTLFGSLCWALARQQGETAIADLLARCRKGDPPLLLSDGFPPDAFPRPLLAPSRPATMDSVADQIAQARRGKAARDRKWLSSAQFAHVLQGLPFETLPVAPLVDTEINAYTTIHNQINRNMGTAGVDDDSANLYAASGEWMSARVFYLRVADDIAFDWRALLANVVETGYGKRKSVGYGAITKVDIEPFPSFGEPSEANGFVSLSAFVPAANDPVNGYWRTEVKYGKLGEEYANAPNPFKLPLLRLLAGAVFHFTGPIRPFYGRLVDEVAPGMPHVAQYGFAFSVPIRLSDAEIKEM